MKSKLITKNFLLILQGDAISTIGDILYSIAVGYWVYQKTGSTALMGVMSSISMVTTMIVQPISGAIVDRLDRKKVIISMDLLRGIMMIVASILAFTNKLSVLQILILSFLGALSNVFFQPAIDTVFIDIIPKDEMMRGQSISQSIANLINLVGKAISGALVAWLGVPFIILLNGISFILSAITEMFIDVPKNKKEDSSLSVSTIIKDIKKGFEYVCTDKILKVFVPSVIIINFIGSGTGPLFLPLMLNKGFSVEQYGYITALITLSSLICVLLLGIKKFNSKQRYWIFVQSFVFSTIIYIIAYSSNNIYVMMIMIFIATALNVVGNTILNAAMMIALPEESKATVLSFISSASIGASGLGTVLVGVLGEFISLQALFIITTVLVLLPILYMCFNKTTKELIYNN